MSKRRKDNVFTHVPVPRVKRNMFDLSHEKKMTGQFGYLYPCMIMDVVPGDTISSSSSVFTRFAPLLAPIMHRVDVKLESFFVPNRIICEPWQEFITGGQDGDAEVVLPYITLESMDEIGAAEWYIGKGSLWDYFGLPTDDGSTVVTWNEEPISALPWRAYWKIWNDFYRDPNFDDEVDLGVDLQGDVTASMLPPNQTRELFSPALRGYEKDYFTSCLPFAQRGAQVLLPIEGTGTPNYWPTGSLAVKAVGGGDAADGPAVFDNVVGGTYLEDNDGDRVILNNIEDVDVVNGTTTINDLRRSFAIQKWLENNARGGARYTEQIRNHFDVVVPDYRLQRAEYLGGMRAPVQISEVLATAGTEEEDGVASPPVGDMAGHGIGAGRGREWSYRCQEHGWIITLVSVTYRTAYQQGLHRMFTRKSKFDFAWPELANIGEQAVLNKEVFFSPHASGDGLDNDKVFGYLPRYAEYKYLPDSVAGDFRDNLAFWHLGRIFTQRPNLDSDFTTIDQEFQEASSRIFAVQDGTDYLWMQIFHRVNAERPLPYFGIPAGLS